jgi:hypothetical protein
MIRQRKAKDATASTSNEEQQQPNKQSESCVFFGGDLNKFYNNLETGLTRDPNNIVNYAVHRWMGYKHSTFEHYHLMRGALKRYHPSPESPIRLFDACCGLGAGLMWFEREEPTWSLYGHTISEGQLDWINNSSKST